MRPTTPIALVVLLYCMAISLTAQDVEQTWKDLKTRLDNPLEVNGGVGLQLQSYGTSLPIDRAVPFNGTLTANLNIRTLGAETPLNFIYSSGGTAFNVLLPSFGFAGMSPTYRDYTLHLGDRTVTLGKYSFSNHSFRGVGGEINKDRWYSRLFYGRLHRAQASDFNGFQNIDPLFRRRGFGILAGGHPIEDGKVEFSLFKAWDEPGSLGTFADSTLIVNPGENVIFSTLIEQNLFQKFKILLNYSNSGFTADRTVRRSDADASKRSLFGILETNGTTRWNNALETRISFLAGFASFDLTYERIDPGYRTMGALFFQDDQENFTIGITTQLFNNVLSLIGNGGLQNNNLDGTRSDKYRRWIGSLQGNLRISKKVSASLGYSNFSSVNRQVRILDPSAPNRLTELALTNDNINASIQYKIGANDQLLSNFTHQNNQTITQDENIAETSNNVTNAMIMYRRNWLEEKLGLGIQIFQNNFSMSFLDQRQLGVNVQVSKSLLDGRLKGSVAMSYLNNQQHELMTDQKKVGNLWQFRPSLNYEIKQGQRISFDGSVLSNHGNNIDAFQESRLRLNYQFDFQRLKKS
ncbi:MAG: hypothetical protein HKN87_18780 [Saprospiraceae bacterium]|nr:hypothetical protein [Saprospiraceae bacterium]